LCRAPQQTQAIKVREKSQKQRTKQAKKGKRAFQHYHHSLARKVAPCVVSFYSLSASHCFLLCVKPRINALTALSCADQQEQPAKKIQQHHALQKEKQKQPQKGQTKVKARYVMKTNKRTT